MVMAIEDNQTPEVMALAQEAVVQIEDVMAQALETMGQVPGATLQVLEATIHSEHDTVPPTIGIPETSALIEERVMPIPHAGDTPLSPPTLIPFTSAPPCSSTTVLVSPGNEVY